MRRKVPYRVTTQWGDHTEDTVLFANYKDDRLQMLSDERGNWFPSYGLDKAIEERILVPVDEEAPCQFEFDALVAEAARVEVQQAADRILNQLKRRPDLAEAVYLRLARIHRP